MIREIRKCKAELDELIASGQDDCGRESELLLVKIKFFQHERMVHLIVTMTICFLTVMSFMMLILMDDVSVPVVLLCVLLLALTAGYLLHYYKLENGVQELYRYYHRLQTAEKLIKNHRRN